MNTAQSTEPVTVGIDAAVTANHHIVVRRPEPGGVGAIVDDFSVAPTLDGLARLTRRLADRDVRVAVAEPTSMTWLGLSLALADAGIDLALVGSRHVARLRGAVSGKNKSDVIDAQLLSRAGELFALQPAVLPDPATLALQRAGRRRHKLLIEANRCWRRIIALGRWAFPDTWNALRGSRAAILAVLRRWPHLDALARARVTSIADEIAAHSRGLRDVSARAVRVRDWARRSGMAASTSTPAWPGPARRRPASGRPSGATTTCCCRSPAWVRRSRRPSGRSSVTAAAFLKLIWSRVCPGAPEAISSRMWRGGLAVRCRPERHGRGPIERRSGQADMRGLVTSRPVLRRGFAVSERAADRLPIAWSRTLWMRRSGYC